VAPGICSKLVRRNLFAKLALTFLALLLGVLVAVDYFTERALRSNYERMGFAQLASLAGVAQAEASQLPALPPANPEDKTRLRNWVAALTASGARVSIIASDGQVFADSLGELENQGSRPEIREAFEKGTGRAIGHSGAISGTVPGTTPGATPGTAHGMVQGDVLYYAVRQNTAGGAPIVLRFALPVEGVNEMLRAFRQRLWLAYFLIMLIAGATSLVIWRSLTDRVERLKEFSHRVAEGDFRALPSNSSGDALDALGISLNQTAARLDKTIRTLTEERNLSSAILGSMVEGVAVVNGSERLVFANPGFAEILDISVPPRSGSALVEVVRQTKLIEAVRAVLSGEARVEVEINAGTVRERFFAATVAAVRASETSGAVMVLHDITDLRKLERVRRDFVANVSHEFRTPLTAIQGFAETLLAGAVDDPQNRGRFLEIILQHARRLAKLTEELLKLSKMDADRLEMEIRRLSVTEFVESCLETARYRAADKDLRISVAIPENLPEIAGDQQRLAEVLQNLLDNSIQYTLPGGEIVLTAQSDGDEVVLTVADTGIGIPKADQLRIFERFYRVDAARSRDGGGTGLGLAIAKHVVEVHGGRIWVESDVGQGSRFHFSVPVFDAERRAVRSPLVK